MIDGADFLKWCEIFGIEIGGSGGDGTVTRVNTGTGLTGGPITTTGTILFADVDDQTFLANTSGGSAPPIPTPLSDLLQSLQDAYDNGDGSILEVLGKPVVLKDITATGDSSSLFDLFSTTKGSRPFPSMTTAERDAILSPAVGLTIYNTDTNQINYYDGSAWQIIESGNVTLQQAYNNGNGTITVLNNNSQPFAVGNDETNIFGTYGVYVSATRNLASLPTEYWFHFFEANDSSSSIVQYGAFSCNATDTTAGSVSGFMALGAATGAKSGEVVPYLYGDGLNQQSGSAFPMIISDTATIVDPSSMFDVFSTNLKGSRPFTSKSTSDINSIVSPAHALFVYDISLDVLKYFDSLAYQTILTIDNLIAGTGITFDQISSPGKIIANVTGSSPGTTSSYASYNVEDNPIASTFATSNTYYPIIIDNTKFSDLESSDFTNSVVSISGRLTPAFTYNGSSTQFFRIDANLFLKGSAASQKQYKFQVGVLRTTSSIDYSGSKGTVILQDLIFPYDVSLSSIVQLNTGDIVFIAVQNITDTSGVYVNALNAAICTTDASQPSQFNFIPISSTSFTMVPNTGYTVNTLTVSNGAFPNVANYGTRIKVNGLGSGGFQLNLNAGQSVIYDGASPSTVGIASTNQYACLTLRTVVANTVFQVESTTGGITLL